MTRVYDSKNFLSFKSDYSSNKKEKCVFVPYSEERMKQYLNEIANIKLSAMTPVRTPICVTLDLSGSVRRFFESIKFLFTTLTDELMMVGRSARQYTLIIMLIHNSEPKLGYIGDLKEFDCENFIDSLPEPHGNTPLAKSFCMVDDYLKQLNDTLENNKHWYTVPVFFTITDSGDNGSADDCADAIKRYTKDIQDGKKLFIEFVTGANPNGLNLGGYKVLMDGKDSKSKIKLFVEALRGATSSDVPMNNTSTIRKPPKENRKEFNEYYSDIMLFNFQMCFERSNIDESEEES